LRPRDVTDDLRDERETADDAVSGIGPLRPAEGRFFSHMRSSVVLVNPRPGL
jgi:hypothetical protein